MIIKARYMVPTFWSKSSFVINLCKSSENTFKDKKMSYVLSRPIEYHGFRCHKYLDCEFLVGPQKTVLSAVKHECLMFRTNIAFG